MDKEIYYNFRVIFTCEMEYELTIEGSKKVIEILSKINEELKIKLTEDNKLLFEKRRNILLDKNEKFVNLQYLLPAEQEVNNLYADIPLKGNISEYFENDEMIYDFHDDDEIPLKIKVEKKIKENKIKNLNTRNAASSGLSKINFKLDDNEEGIEVDLPFDEDLFFHPEKLTKLSAKTYNITNKMLSEKKIVLPIFVDLEVDDFPGHPKASIDLICVIDKSGSMTGEPIDSVRKSLEALVENLTEKDRLCLIVFDSRAKRITKLMQVNAANREELIKIINSN